MQSPQIIAQVELHPPEGEGLNMNERAGGLRGDGRSDRRIAARIAVRTIRRASQVNHRDDAGGVRLELQMPTLTGHLSFTAKGRRAQASQPCS